jgi:hypothetical protein
MAVVRRAYKPLSEDLKESGLSKHLGPRCNWQKEVKMELREEGRSVQWRALVNTVMKRTVPQNADKS